MANETLLTNVDGLVEDISAESIFVFNQHAGILKCVDHHDTSGKPGLTLDFPKWGALTSANVQALTEGTDNSTNVQVTVADTAAAATEHGLMAFISDMAMKGTTPRNLVVESTGKLFADATLAKLEDDIVNLFADFNSGNDLAGAGTSMTEAHWFQSLEFLKTDKADVNNLCAVLSPKQVWGAKGLRPLIVGLKVDAGNLGEEMKAFGFTHNVFGIDVLVSNEINEDVGSGGDAAGCIFDKRAIGLHTKDMFSIEHERNASLRGFELVMTSLWNEVELHDTFGCYFLSDVA
jgi:hypothetical protein